MKIKMIVCSALAASLLAGCCCEKGEHGKRCGEGKVSKEVAQAAALAKVPNGTVKEAQMEKYKGKLYWTFEIAPGGSAKDIEVAVDPNTGKVVWMSNEKDDDKEDAANISKETAQASALAKVPGGTVKEGELEKEKGKLIWSFDITTPDSKDITEVAVDAVTGAVIAVEKETPADQAKEAAEDAANAKKDKN